MGHIREENISSRSQDEIIRELHRLSDEIKEIKSHYPATAGRRDRSRRDNMRLGMYMAKIEKLCEYSGIDISLVFSERGE